MISKIIIIYIIFTTILMGGCIESESLNEKSIEKIIYVTSTQDPIYDKQISDAPNNMVIETDNHQDIICGDYSSIKCGDECSIKCGNSCAIICGADCVISCGNLCGIAHLENCKIQHGHSCSIIIYTRGHNVHVKAGS